MSMPNTILITVEDLGYGDLSCYGSPLVRTPTLDTIADEGIQFLQMSTGAPQTTPSRAGLLTGRYGVRLGLTRELRPGDPGGLPASARTLASFLGDSGHVSGVFGTWRLGSQSEHHPLRHGFTRFFGLFGGALYDGETMVESNPDRSEFSARCTDAAIAFISDHADQPFLLHVAYPLFPFEYPVSAQARGRSAAGDYGDAVEAVDADVDRLAAELDRRGLADETVLIVTSDNGPWRDGSTAGLRSRKNDQYFGRSYSTYEGGVRVPFVVRWPAVIPGGTVNNDPGALVDVVPTVCDATGTDVGDAPLDGRSMLPTLRGESQPPRGAIFYHFQESLDAVRLGRWKLQIAHVSDVAGRRVGTLLHDLDADPSESYDLADGHPEVVEQLQALMDGFDDDA